MSFWSDLQEIPQIWKKSSTVSKILIGVSIFLTTTSLMSLSDAIVKWRYWFRDFLEFRQILMDWLLQPFHWLALRYDWIVVPEWFGDVMTLVVILIVAACRGLIQLTDEKVSILSVYYIVLLNVALIAFGLLNLEWVFLSIYIISCWVVTSSVFLFLSIFNKTLDKIKNSNLEVPMVILVFVFFLPILMIGALGHSIGKSETPESEELAQSQFRVSYLGGILLALLILIILVGIHAGMTATLK